MGRRRPTDSADLIREALRVGARRFVVRFATRHRVEGHAPRAAAELAIGDLTREALARVAGILGIQEKRQEPRRRLGRAASPAPGKKTPPRPQSVRHTKPRRPPENPDPLAELKRRGVDPRDEGKKPT